MAEDNEVPEEGGGGGKKKIIIFAVIGLVVIGLTIGGTLMAVKMLTPEPEPEMAVDENGNPVGEEAEEEAPAEGGPAIYVPLKPPIIVNFEARGRQRFMQADVSLMTRDNDVIDAIEVHMPMLRNSLVLKFGGQEYEELQTEEGRELLRQEALKELQDLLEKETGKRGIEKLLFTNLVMQ